jgi:hypothetical protein
MLTLAGRIAIAWTLLSLLLTAFWVLLLEVGYLWRRARQARPPIGTSPQTLSEREVEALLTTPVASDPIGIDRTSRRVREPKVAK